MTVESRPPAQALRDTLDERAESPAIGNDPWVKDELGVPSASRSAADPEVQRTLGLGRSRPRLRRTLIALLSIAALAGGIAAWLRFSRPTPVEYAVARAEIADLVVSVSTTGTVEPRSKVEVGPQISGRIASVHADFNDQVQAGQVLVELDRTQLRARVSESRARLVAARAGLRDARVAVEEAKQNLARTESLVKEGLLPQQELVTRDAAERRAAAAVDSAAAQVQLAQATLTAAETDLAWATVRAPISGVILSRTAEPGQVVAAAFQPPVLFVIAENLKTMELHVDIDEADVGRVRTGQAATFTVDAYPSRTFSAKVESVRNSPRTVQNVVTYEGILSVNNADEELKPGMTANVVITAEKARSVLVVSNAALRFTPPKLQETPEQRREQRVFLPEGDGFKRVVVHPGPSDGQKTMLRAGDLEPGTTVLTNVKQDAHPGP